MYSFCGSIFLCLHSTISTSCILCSLGNDLHYKSLHTFSSQNASVVLRKETQHYFFSLFHFFFNITQILNIVCFCGLNIKIHTWYVSLGGICSVVYSPYHYPDKHIVLSYMKHALNLNLSRTVLSLSLP